MVDSLGGWGGGLYIKQSTKNAHNLIFTLAKLE